MKTDWQAISLCPTSCTKKLEDNQTSNIWINVVGDKVHDLYNIWKHTVKQDIIYLLLIQPNEIRNTWFDIGRFALSAFIQSVIGLESSHCYRRWPTCLLIEAEWRIYASVNWPSSVQAMACRCQAIIWTNAGILLTGTLGTNFSEAKFQHDHSSKCIQKCHLRNGGLLVSASMCQLSISGSSGVGSYMHVSHHSID